MSNVRARLKQTSQKFINSTAAIVLMVTGMGGVLPMLAPQAASAAAAPEVVYDSLASVSPLTNYTSLGYQATSTREFGDQVHLSKANSTLSTVTVTMSDWAKFSDYASDARFMDNDTSWAWPITLNIYGVGTNNTVGSLLATKTRAVKIPWLPAQNCPSDPTAWEDASGNCNHGLAFNAAFDLSSLNVTLPSDVIVAVAFNTQSYGATPVGVAGPYNSLNVATPDGQIASVGSDASADTVFWNSTYDHRTAGLSADTGWTPNGTLPFEITAIVPNPVVEITSPVTNGAVVPNSSSVTVHATDTVNLNKVVVHLTGPSTATIPNNSCLWKTNTVSGTDQTITCSLAGLPDGTYTLKAGASDDAGYSASTAVRTFTIDSTPPVTTAINYTPAGPTPTNHNVSVEVLTSEPVKANGFPGTWNVYSNGVLIGTNTAHPDAYGNRFTKAITQNATNNITLVDAAGNTTSTAATVTWIDKTAPDGTFTYSNNSAPTNGNVYAYLTTTEPVTISPTGSHGWEATDATGLHFKHKFTGNGSFDAVITDAAGNSKTLTATVNWIDKTAPSILSYAYSNNGNLTKDDVTVTITTSEPVETPTDWTKVDDTHFTKVFAHNGGFYVDLTDLVGNTATVGGKSQGAEVKRIDKNAPVISGVTDGAIVSGPVQLSVTDPSYEGADGFDANHGLNVNGSDVATTPGPNKTYLYDITAAGQYTVVATDKAGNPTTLHFTIAPADDQSGQGSDGSEDTTTDNASGLGSTALTFVRSFTPTSNFGQVLGTSTTTSNTNTGTVATADDDSNTDNGNKAVKGAKTTVENADSKSSKNFLGLGWWWLLVLLAAVALGYAIARSRSEENN